ncbi:autotransporter outer membrane beta-barrel domain-containing protein [Phascolarctobacterium faecium]|nr:autotransporter outer membrane beta-barrel domain-containing protein [Phascolarctobacterium faecium]MDM8111741.1 autotransporter outer membrane beta-barrel domain-containing protein [Phascolarctobacterium faecium]
MKNSKLLAKSITLGLILAMPYGIVNAAEYRDSIITGWGGSNGGELKADDVSYDIKVTNSGTQIVNKGATANDTVLADNGGRQDVYGTAIGTQVGKNAHVYVRGGNASKLENNGGTIHIGGEVNYGGEIGIVNYDGTVTGMTMNSGNVTVTNGILENSIIDGGYVRVQTDGKADRVTLNSGVTLDVNDGHLENSTVNGANVVINGTASKNTITAGSMILKDGKITGTNINGSGALLQMESGNVSGTTVNSGTFTIQQGIAENTTLNSGTINLQKGELKETTANGGIVNVSGGTLDTIELKGSVENSIRTSLNLNGGTAERITAYENVYIGINGAQVTNLKVNGAKSGISMNSGSLTSVSLTGVDSNNTAGMTIRDGNVSDLTINNYGVVTVEGGTVTHTVIKENGWQGVQNDAVVNNTTIESGGRQTIYDDAKSSNVTVNTGAELVVNQGAEAENVKSDGTIYMRDDAQLTGTTELTQNAVIDLGGIVNGLYAEVPLSGHEESGNYSINNLHSNGAGVKVFTESQKLNIDSLSGSEFVVTTDALGDGLVTIENNTNQNVQVIGTSTATSQFNRNDLAGSLQDLADTVEITNGNQLDSVLAQECGIIGETTALVDEYGNIIANTVIEKGHIANEGITELANVAFMAWRAENDEMHQRMGELRSSNGEAGIWARMKRGESKYGDMDIKNQYSTYQLGYDEKVGDSNWYIGGAISRTEGKSSFATGSGENQSTGFTVYGTYVADDGQYIDLSAKYARLDNEFDVFGRSGIESTGDYRNNGYAFSAEYGKRIEAGNDFWVEPQVQLTYGHLSSANYTTSRDVRVTQDAMDSVVGRLGFAAGKDIGAGNVYVKASYLYDFDGDTNVKMTDGKNNAVYDQDLGGGWFEVGIGTNINLSETSHLYFDVEKTYGGDIETPWQWNAGVRFDF